jgi:hypothetical protein
MLVVETIARIRREHFVKGKTIKEIARDLGISRNTVRKVLRSGETSFDYERTVQPRPKLGRWTDDRGVKIFEGAAFTRQWHAVTDICRKPGSAGRPASIERRIMTGCCRAGLRASISLRTTPGRG